MDLREAYRVLEVKPGATKDEVRDARNVLAKVWHPDRHQGDARLHARAEQKLKDVNEAYSVIERAGFPSAIASEPQRPASHRPSPQPPPPTPRPTPPPPPPSSVPPHSATRSPGPPQGRTGASGSSGTYVFVALLLGLVLVVTIGVESREGSHAARDDDEAVAPPDHETTSDEPMEPTVRSGTGVVGRIAHGLWSVVATASGSGSAGTGFPVQRQDVTPEALQHARPSLSGPLITMATSCIESGMKGQPADRELFVQRSCFCLTDYVMFQEHDGRPLAPPGNSLRDLPGSAQMKTCMAWAETHQGAEPLNGSPYFDGPGLSSERIVYGWKRLDELDAKRATEPVPSAFAVEEFENCLMDIFAKKSRWPHVYTPTQDEVRACATPDHRNGGRAPSNGTNRPAETRRPGGGNPPDAGGLLDL